MSSEDDEIFLNGSAKKQRKTLDVDFNIKKPGEHAKVKFFFVLNYV